MSKSIKNRLRAALVVPALALGLGVGVLAPVAVPAANAACSTGGNLSISGGVDCSKGNDQPPTLFGAGGIFQTITNVLLFIIGAISVIMLIIGGIRYTVSGGDQSAVKAAKDTILYAVVGIIVALLAYAIVNFVVTSFAK